MKKVVFPLVKKESNIKRRQFNGRKKTIQKKVFLQSSWFWLRQYMYWWKQPKKKDWNIRLGLGMRVFVSVCMYFSGGGKKGSKTNDYVNLYQFNVFAIRNTERLDRK